MTKEWTKKELVKFYTDRLEKVKQHWNPEKANSAIQKERCIEYIKKAKQDLAAVKKGRKW